MRQPIHSRRSHPAWASQTPSILGYAAAACSGVIVGFVSAGHFTAAGLAFACVCSAVLIGWAARGIAQ